MGQRPGLVLVQRLQPVAPNLLKITNISILVVPNIPTTRMLILLILIILPATPFPLSPSISTPLLFPHAIPLIQAFHTTPVPARQTPLTARSQILSKHPRIPCLTAIPYLFAMASMASGQREGIPFIIYRLFVIFVSGTVIAVTVPDILIILIMEKIASNENFAEILSDSKPVLVDFWATWCGPCRMLAPTVDTIASEYDGKVTVVKCNVDDCEDVAAEYGIRNIPTLLFFKGGQVVDKLVGNVPKSEITAKLDTLV